MSKAVRPRSASRRGHRQGAARSGASEHHGTGLEAAHFVRGLNASLISTSGGDTITGASGMQIDSSTASTTATLELKLVEALATSDNELVTAGQANTRWVVKINNHQLVVDGGATGV